MAKILKAAAVETDGGMYKQLLITAKKAYVYETFGRYLIDRINDETGEDCYYTFAKTSAWRPRYNIVKHKKIPSSGRQTKSGYRQDRKQTIKSYDIYDIGTEEYNKVLMEMLL